MIESELDHFLDDNLKNTSWSGQRIYSGLSCPSPYGPMALCAIVQICSRQICEPLIRFHLPPTLKNFPASYLCKRPENFRIGRGERICSSDPLHPMQVRYQAALRPGKSVTSYKL